MGLPMGGRRESALKKSSLTSELFWLKKNTMFIVAVHLAIQASLQALHLNPKNQIIQIN